ncbi:ribosomal protein l16p/L10e domain-containing protein [Phthorimaea operculella]|nr:ribosomal protein l16p/L10e domain-containing protein [Phthorimaea operculella]
MLFQSIRLSLGMLRPEGIQLTSIAGIKYFPPPKNYDHIEIPDRQRLRVYDKVPTYPANLKPPKMQKRLRYMRVVARRLNQKIMFAIWRIDPPWQPITKKGQGQRMGGGKGAIDHYATPIKAGRVILEVGGKCEYAEVKDMLRIVAERLPFKAEPVSQEILERKAAAEKLAEERNQNRWTMEYIIKNNMGGCHKMLSPFDHKWYGKYL